MENYENNNTDSSWSELLKKKRIERENEILPEKKDPEPRTFLFHIDGMTCTSCEMRIDKMVRKLTDVKEVKTSYSNSSLWVRGEDSLSPGVIIECVHQLGYTATISSDKKNSKTDSFTIMQLIGIGVIIAAVWLILDKTGVFNMLPEINQSMGYGILFVVGLITGLHCIAMCGGINLSQSLKGCNTRKTAPVTDRFLPGLLYNLGRVISYTVIGGIVGAIGSVINLTGQVQGIVVLLAGTFMIIMGLNMLNIFPWLKKINIRMPKIIGEKIDRSKSNKGPFIVGLLNGFMPCGPLQAMQLYALGTGNFFAGAFSMFLFSVGTVPVMFGFSAISALLSKKFTHKMMKISAILVMLLGIAMVGRGLSLNGLSFGPPLAEIDESNIARIQGNVQVVTTTLTPSAYEPIIVQKGVPVRWNLQAPAGSINGCNNPVTIPSLGMRIRLQEGDNYIEFTPEKEGNITYTCWMGMITSVIKVVDDLGGVSDADVKEVKDASSTTYNTTVDPGTATVAVLDGDVQRVETELLRSRYEPIIVQQGIPVIWTFNASTQELTSCNNRINIPDLTITKTLKPGANVIEFTPENTGKIVYTCWMNMIQSVILVVEDITQVDESTIKEAASSAAASSCGGCASGTGGCGTGNSGCGTGLPNTGSIFSPDVINTDDILSAEIINGVQYITVTVDENGYSPAVIVMQAGVPTEWNFKGITLTDANYRMEFPMYRVRLELKDGDNMISQFIPQIDFTYNSWKGDFTGFIAVVKDINTVDFRIIRDRVKNYTPPAPPSGGGCCG